MSHILNSPVFTGTPTAPTAEAGTSTTQIATCAYVQTAIGSIASNGASFITANAEPDLANEFVLTQGSEFVEIDTMLATAKAYLGSMNSYLSQKARLAKNVEHQI